MFQKLLFFSLSGGLVLYKVCPDRVLGPGSVSGTDSLEVLGGETPVPFVTGYSRRDRTPPICSLENVFPVVLFGASDPR